LDLSAVTSRLGKAALETAGQLLWFQGKPAFTPYTRDCGGTTEDAASVWPDLAAPYLTSHADPYCRRVPAAPWRWIADPPRILQALHQSQLRGPRTLDRIAIAERTSSGRASVLTLAGPNESIRISASSFRFAVGRALGWNTIRGDRYEVHSSNGQFIFEGSSEGHSVGLCQRGAEQMGLTGRSYREILAFYYPGTVVGLTGQGLAWHRLGGDTMALFTTHPDQDRIALAIAERQGRALSQRVGWPLPSGIEIRVYPDLDTFRNATGEPGWVAARTEGRSIHLQPVALLRSRDALESTLSHELLHVLIESQAAPGLPVWFREGLVGFFEGRGTTANARVPSDRVVSDVDLRQMADAATARRAYSDAAAMVASLVRTYGETTVRDWVKRGLPPDVMKQRTSQEPAKSK
jgi:stage II sporulation protein D